MTVATVMLLPSRASATVYTWAQNRNGDWTTPANWFCDGTTGSCANGFPNGRGDQARFTGNIGNIFIALDRPIRIGSIVLSRFGFQFLTLNNAGQFIFDNGDAPAAIVRDDAPADALTFLGLPMRLESQLRIATGPRELHMQAVISGPAGITVDAQSLVTFSSFALAPNTFQGRTIVNSGTLILGAVDSEIGVVLPGGLAVGNGDGIRDAAVFVKRFGMLPVNAPITVNSDGVLEFQADQHIGDLGMIGTAVVTALTSTLDLMNVTMSGANGILEAKNGGALKLHGDIVAESGLIRGFGGVGVPALVLDGQRTITVTANDTLFIDSLNILGDANAGIIKAGPGTLTFMGTATNTYQGNTTFAEGTVNLSGTGVTVPARLTIGNGRPAAVNLSTPSIAPTSNVVVSPNALLHTFVSQAFSSLSVLNSGRLQVDGASTVISTLAVSMLGGHTTLGATNTLALTGDLAASSRGTQTAIIDGGGQLLLNGDRTIDVADGPQPIDLQVDVPVATVNALRLTKRGGGIAIFTQANAYTAATKVSEGTLFVNGAQGASAIELSGGVLAGNGQVGFLQAFGGNISPGASPGRLSTAAVPVNSTV